MRKVESPLSLITGSSISLQKENNKHLIFLKNEIWLLFWSKISREQAQLKEIFLQFILFLCIFKVILHVCLI